MVGSSTRCLTPAPPAHHCTPMVGSRRFNVMFRKWAVFGVNKSRSSVNSVSKSVIHGLIIQDISLQSTFVLDGGIIY